MSPYHFTISLRVILQSLIASNVSLLYPGVLDSKLRSAPLGHYSMPLLISEAKVSYAFATPRLNEWMSQIAIEPAF
jgi:hypothetical protein